MAITESTHAAEFLVSEANGWRSRKTITIAKGAALTAGTVLGTVTASGQYAQHDPKATDGTEVATGILYGNVDATAADQQAVAIVRDAEVARAGLTFKTGIANADKKAAMAALETAGVVAR